MSRYHRVVSGPDLSAPFRVLEGMVVIYLARDRSIVIPAGGAWPGLSFLPEPLATHLTPMSAVVIPGTRTGPSDDQDREAAVALVLAQALIGVGLLSERVELAEQLQFPMRDMNQETAAKLVGTARETFTRLLRS